MGAVIPSPERQSELRVVLPDVLQLLQRRRAGEIGEDVIDALVGLEWIEWNGGSLRATTTGQNICKQQSIANALAQASK